MSKIIRRVGVTLALFLSLLPSIARAQWDFIIVPDELQLPPGSVLYNIGGYLFYAGSTPIEIQFVSFTDGLVAAGVTTDDTPFYDWIFNELTDRTLSLEPEQYLYFPLFHLTVDADAPLALYTPTAVLEFDEIGGASGVALGASWTLEVVPEPATVTVLASGVAILLVRGAARRRKM